MTPARSVPTASEEHAVPDRVERLMPELKGDFIRLARIPSVTFPEFPTTPVLKAHDLVDELLRNAGVDSVDTLSLPRTAPIIIGEIPAPAGAPTVLLYAHYDVQPAGDERLWNTPPFEPTERDGAIYGRGVADDKANLIAHLGALRAFDGRPPVGIKKQAPMPLLRGAAREVIQATPGFGAIGEAASGEEALGVVAELESEHVLLARDGQHPDRQRIRTGHPEVVVVLISIEDPANLPVTARACGAAALARKQDFGPRLLRSLWLAHGAAR